MKTKEQTFYIDLEPGWQDLYMAGLMPTSCCPSCQPLSGYRRVKFTVALPCFGGTADVTDMIPSVIKAEVVRGTSGEDAGRGTRDACATQEEMAEVMSE